MEREDTREFVPAEASPEAQAAARVIFSRRREREAGEVEPRLAGQARVAEAPVMVARHARRLRKVAHHSQVLGVDKTFYVYVPETPRTVRTARTARFPVVYFFRGHEDEWVNPRQDYSRRRRTVIDAYEDLVRRGKVGPMVLVFPGMASTDNHIPGLAVNMKDPQLVAEHHGGLGNGRFQDYLFEELVPLVEQRWPVKPGGAHRGLIGFSLGGYMAVKIALSQRGFARTVGSYDGLILWKDVKVDATLRNMMFDAAFGVPRDLSFIEQNSPLHMMSKIPKAELERMSWFIEYGPEVAEPNDSNYYRGHELVRRLSRLGIKNTGGTVWQGRHDWRTADDHVARTLAAHFAALS